MDSLSARHSRIDIFPESICFINHIASIALKKPRGQPVPREDCSRIFNCTEVNIVWVEKKHIQGGTLHDNCGAWHKVMTNFQLKILQCLSERPGINLQLLRRPYNPIFFKYDWRNENHKIALGLPFEFEFF